MVFFTLVAATAKGLQVANIVFTAAKQGDDMVDG